jgi:hypothetical protein
MKVNAAASFPPILNFIEVPPCTFHPRKARAERV